MPDRILRDELLESDRWLDLPTDTDRLAFIGLVLKADDYGNLRGGPRRIFRTLQRFTQIKSEDNATTAMLHLVDADLVRRYEVEKQEFWHLPRFRSRRSYWSRAVPASPWDEKHEESKIQRFAKNVAPTEHQRSTDVCEGVGVGVGDSSMKVLPNSEKTTRARPVDKSTPGGNKFPLKSKAERQNRWWLTEATMLAEGLLHNVKPRPGEEWPDFRARINAAIELEKRS